MAADNPHNSSPRKSSKHLPYHASVGRIAANEAEIVLSSVYNVTFNWAIYQDMDDVSARFDRFVEETQKRWESKATSHTPPGLARDIDRIRMIAEQLKEHLVMYGSNPADDATETFQCSLGKIQHLLELAATHPEQPQLPTTSASPRRLDRLASPASKRIPETYGASDWADEELMLWEAREQMSRGSAHAEASTTLLEESETSSLLADSIHAVAGDEPHIATVEVMRCRPGRLASFATPPPPPPPPPTDLSVLYRPEHLPSRLGMTY